jgi:hypothetical protein
MNWNKHYLKSEHAFLGASSYHWLNYDKDQLARAWHAAKAKEKGTELHAFAAQCIKLGQKLPRSTKTLNQYVNDAIGFHMVPEQILYYSDFAYGTADSISSLDSIMKDKFVRIHDLKTGVTPAKMEQLRIYLAYLCLEYHIDPLEIDAELRLYQNSAVKIENPDRYEIEHIMDKTIEFNQELTRLKEEES